MIINNQNKKQYEKFHQSNRNQLVNTELNTTMLKLKILQMSLVTDQTQQKRGEVNWKIDQQKILELIFSQRNKNKNPETHGTE